MRILSLLVLGLLAGSAEASGRTFRQFSCGTSYGYHQQAVYHAPTYAPIYSVGYQPDLSALVTIAEAVKAQGERQEQIMQALLQGGQFRDQQQAPPHPGLLAMRNACAKCHDESVAKSKGKGYVFFRGGLPTDEVLKDPTVLIDAVNAGTMPKDDPGWKRGGDDKYQFLAFWTLKPPDVAQPSEPVPPPSKPPTNDASELRRMIAEAVDAAIDAKLKPAPVEEAFTIGILKAGPNKGNWLLETADETFGIGFDDQNPDWPELQKALPGWVGKTVQVFHRPGYFGVGDMKMLLARTAKLRK